MNIKKYRLVVLVILDGWGITAPSRGNAISQADTPVMEKLIKNYPATTIQASGEAVGLPWVEMGNSEVGHMNLGSGRIIFQDLPRINNAIESGLFFENEAFLKAIKHVQKNNSSLHLMGLLSPGGVHSHQDHLYALLALAKKHNLTQVFIHVFLDGRDTEPRSGITYLQALEREINTIKRGKIVSISGRFYALDRDRHWDRVQRAYEAMVFGRGKKIQDFYQEIQNNYDNNIFDENIEPMVIVDQDGSPQAEIEDNDALIFYNYRADRAREISHAFLDSDFDKFKRGQKIRNLFFVGMTEYDKDLPLEVAFKEEEIKMTLAEILSKANLTQLHIAETEKYAHVTRFFDGGREKPFSGEDYVLIDSPRVENYAEVPKMSAYKVTERLLQEVSKRQYNFVVVNFANPDMVGHTGNISAAIKAVEVTDKCLGKVVDKVLSLGGALVIVADHGNAESMLNLRTGTIETEHTKNPVPFILVAKEFKGKGKGQRSLYKKEDTYPTGLLSDVAPSVLSLLGVPKPKEMTGINLVEVLLGKS